jgi:hypothetical protein
MTSADANKAAAVVVAVPVSAIEVEVLDVPQIAIIRNPPADLAQTGIRDGVTWRQYGDDSGYDFFDPILKGERALPVGEAQTWIFADGDREIAIRGMLIADDVAEPPGEAEPLTLSELVARSYTVAPTLRPPGPRAASPQAAARFSETPRLALPDIPLNQIMAAPEETDYDRAIRKGKEYELLRLDSEPRSALGPGAAYACGDYDPFHDL